MNTGKPVKVKVEYDNGLVTECSVEALSPEAKRDLRGLGLLSLTPEPLGGDQKYLLIEWKNGWKEVYSVPADVSDVRRYYVIERVEEKGRLFLDRKEGYPELVEILRKPKEVESVTLL